MRRHLSELSYLRALHRALVPEHRRVNGGSHHLLSMIVTTATIISIAMMMRVTTVTTSTKAVPARRVRRLKTKQITVVVSILPLPVWPSTRLEYFSQVQEDLQLAMHGAESCVVKGIQSVTLESHKSDGKASEYVKKTEQQRESNFE